MRLVALVSGGKDSLYAASLCLKQGHTIQCIANLYPPPLDLSAGDSVDDPRADELDSWMFQTVGHELIGALAEACCLPLVRRPITGSAVISTLDYDGQQLDAGERKLDEVEDLYALLTDVLSQFPDVEGVCSGAILSTYQRNRVESVCNRLNLVSFAPLWQCDQDVLLDDMVRFGLDAVLVKVAGVGLKQVHLGRSLADMQPTLRSLHDKYGSHVCGEGGEFESFVLHCPGLMVRRLVLQETQTLTTDDDEMAPVAYLRAKSFVLAELEGDAIEFHECALRLFAEASSHVPPKVAVPVRYNLAQAPFVRVVPPLGLKHGDVLSQCQTIELGTARLVAIQCTVKGASADASLCARALLTAAADIITSLPNISIKHVYFVFVFLRDIADFGLVNIEFARLFRARPPARALAAVLDGVGEMEMRMQFFACSDFEHTTRILRVQSVSSWAPACIGPYAQCHTVSGGSEDAPRVLHVAGQIGLDPFSMDLVKPAAGQLPFALQLETCIAHVNSILTMEKSSLANVRLARVFVDVSSSLSYGLGKEQLHELLYEKLAVFPHFIVIAVSPKALPRQALCEIQVDATEIIPNSEQGRLQMQDFFAFDGGTICRFTEHARFSIFRIDGTVPTPHDKSVINGIVAFRRLVEEPAMLRVWLHPTYEHLATEFEISLERPPLVVPCSILMTSHENTALSCIIAVVEVCRGDRAL